MDPIEERKDVSWLAFGSCNGFVLVGGVFYRPRVMAMHSKLMYGHGELCVIDFGDHYRGCVQYFCKTMF